MSMTTITYPAGFTNNKLNQSVQYQNGEALLDAVVVNTRRNPAEPDFVPIATLARGLVDHDNNVTLSGHGNGSSKARGQVPIPSGATDITLTGLGLKFTPVGANVEIIHASSGKTEVRAFLVGTPTSDGLVVHLSGATGDGTYILSFNIW